MMTSGNNRLVFFGNERLATGTETELPHLKMLLAAGYNIATIVTKSERLNSRKKQDSQILAFAKLHNIPVITPNKLIDIQQDLTNLDAQIGVLVAYGKIIPEGIIDIFPHGIVNVHPSLLPLHRGPTPIESVILNGELETGVSLMSLVKDMDAGPVYAHSTIQLSGRENKPELCDALSAISVAMLKELLPGILAGTVVAAPQDHAQATYDSLIKKSEGFIDWKKPAVVLEREVRAYVSWPKSIVTLDSVEVILLETEVIKKSHTKPGAVQISGDSLIVDCGEDSLVITRLQPTGKKPMNVGDFLRGYGDRIQASGV